MFLEVLEENAARTMDDAFGHSCGARGIENKERVVERNLGKINGFNVLKRLNSLIPRLHAFLCGERFIFIRKHNNLFKIGESFEKGRDPFKAVKPLSFVIIAVRHEEDFGFCLAKAIQNTVYAKVRRAGGPEGAQGRSCQHSNDGLWRVGRIASDMIASLNSH